MGKQADKYEKLLKHESGFRKYFGEDAEEYLEIYRMRCVEGLSYEMIAEKVYSSKSSIRRRITEIDAFIECPEEKVKQRMYMLEELDGSYLMPNDFIEGFHSLSLNANKVFAESIYLYQHRMESKIPREHLIRYSSGYCNVARRRELVKELERFHILLRSGECIKIYKEFIDIKGTMQYEFTFEALKYIEFDPFKRLMIFLAEHHMEV